jgi:hypothetical protein
MLLTGSLLDEVDKSGSLAFEQWLRDEVMPAYDDAENSSRKASHR